MNIYVGNLSLDITEGELRREFMAFGAVISVVIMNDRYIGSGQTRGYGFDLPVHYTPSCNQLAVEWEYDASLPRQFHMIVPARTFFSPRDLWWDGRDGYRLVDGRITFRDPSVTEDGPAALIADAKTYI